MATTAFDSSGPHVEETHLDDVELFVLGGEFDAYSAPRLEQVLTESIDRGNYEVVVDMSAVTFCDMSTLNAIVRAIKLVYRHNGHLVVGCNSRPVLRAIELAGMRHSIKVYATRDDALTALQPEPAGR
jgi:anti-sigma B factor antagonist